MADARISQAGSLGTNTTGEVFAGIKKMFIRKYEVVDGYPMPKAECSAPQRCSSMLVEKQIGVRGIKDPRHVLPWLP